MDEYTKKTRDWLDNRFNMFDSNGVYHAHQPVYGFRKGHCETGLISRYIITYQIMKLLSQMDFSSLLDVGGAEGYKAYMVKELFQAKVVSSDLSGTACKRAKDMFSLNSIASDIHKLPFKENSFDIVLCSETLEHISTYNNAVEEMLRVAKKAVVISVPHESRRKVEKNIKNNIPHSHIHHFDAQSFNFTTSKHNYKTVTRFLSSPLLTIPAIMVDAMPTGYDKNWGYPKFFIDAYNLLLPLFKRIWGIKTAHFLMELDQLFCRMIPLHNTLLFAIIKDPNFSLRRENKKITPASITDTIIPYHYRH